MRLIMVAVLGATSLIAATATAQETASSANNPRMAAIFAADQSARQNIAPEKFKDKAFIAAMISGDRQRREETRALLDQNALSTGEDYRAAAFVFQHGQAPEDYLLAHSLAVAAVARGSRESTWIAAATLDRYLQMTGQKQIYGTQTRKDHDAPLTLEPYDRALIPDSLRQALNVPSLAQQDAKLMATNAAAATR